MMSATAEARIKGDRKTADYNLCGDCGQIGSETSEFLCEDCRQSILMQDTEEEPVNTERMRVAFPTEEQANAFIEGIEYLEDDHVMTEGPEADLDSDGAVEYAVFIRRFA